MKILARLALLATLAVGAALPALAGVQPLVAPGVTTTLNVTHGGEKRSYLVYVPSSLRTSTSRSALLMLHGGEGDAQSALRTTRLIAATDAAGFVAVFPQTSGGRQWSDGRPETAGHDDVGYIRKVVDELVAYQRVSRSRVFVAGMSNGGMMTQRLACEAASVFAGAGSVIANLPEALKTSCRPTRGIPMIVFHGKADPLMPFGGGALPQTSDAEMGVGGRVLSQAATRDLWKARAGCQRSSGSQPMINRYDDGTRAFREVLDRCARPITLQFWVIEGAGHTWPGGSATSGATAALLGRTSQEVNATQAIVNFLEPHGL